MPKVADLPGKLRVSQFYNDHDPPHFHVWKSGDDALIRIADFVVIRGALSGADLAVVTNRARAHHAEIALNWVLARANIAIRDIPCP
jgi:hypothetical protein